MNGSGYIYNGFDFVGNHFEKVTCRARGYGNNTTCVVKNQAQSNWNSVNGGKLIRLSKF
jgi:hypothetical protein